jgi:cytochrome c553
MALMHLVANKLSDMDIVAVAAYYGTEAGVPAGDSDGSHK